ncbi:Transglutaminase-like superfamily protein [Flavobacterium daejeonense]|nr:Transglutaminase-like superfamily protein [Flavobacterium daejeonense]
MKIKFSIITFILFLTVFSSNAQDFRLGKVSIEELKEKVHPKDSSAAAAILFEKGVSNLVYNQTSGFEIELVVKARIKIYKKEGYEWANKAVRYYLENSLREKVVFSDVATYNLVNGKIEKTKLKSDGEFDEVINKYWGQKKITLPNVKEGSVIEYEYTLHTPSIGNPRDWCFQSDIPVNYSEYVTLVPEYFIFNTNVKGFVRPTVNVVKSTKTIRIDSKERVTNGFGGAVSTNFISDNVNYTETRTTYLVENMPAIKDEAFVNNIRNYTTSVEHELSMTQFPNALPKKYSTNWDAVVETIYKYDDFGPELNKTGYFEDDLNQIIKGLNTLEEKIEAVFTFVKTKVKWNGYYGYSCEEGVRKAYKNGAGNVADINLMLTAMLRYSELNANPVLLSTRSNGISFFPNRTAFNYVIAAVETDKGLILLDATEKYAVPNILPLRDLNWFGRLIRKNGTSENVNLMPEINSREFVSVISTIDSEGVINGKVKQYHVNHEALKFRQKHLVTNKDNYLESLESRNSNIEIDDYERENELDLSKPVIENYSFRDNKTSEVINGKIYISPMAFFAVKENPFKQEVREYPVDFGYPIQEKYTISLKIPEGYEVESMPKSMTVDGGEKIGVFRFVIANNNGQIQIVSTSDIYSSIVTPEYYATLKDFFQKSIEKQNERIVLKKI